MSSVGLGTDVETGGVVRIGDIERRSGLYILGKPGMGKSALSVNIALQDSEHGYGLFFLDAHGDAIVDLTRRLSPDKLKQAYLFDVEDDDYSFGINLLSCKNVASLREREATYTRAFNVFAKIWEWEENWGVWLQLFLQNILRAFIENQDYTLADVPMFLNPGNTEFREHIINNIRYSPEVADFWRFEFFARREQDQQARIEAALTRINTLLTHRYVRDIVGQQKTTVDFENLVSSKDIFLFRLPANLAEDQKKFIGTILISELLHAVRARREGARDQFCLFIDEFHNYASNADMGTMITEGRKFGLASTYMHVERFGQLANNQRLMGATLATVNKVFFQIIVPDAEESAPEFAKEADEVKTRTGGELVYSPHAVEDIWERGHTNQEFMIFRERYLFIVDLLRKNPHEKYFLFNPARLHPKHNSHENPVLFRFEDFDWEWYRASSEMLHEGILLLNQYYYDWMRGKWSGEKLAVEQFEIVLKIVKNLGGIYGFLPLLAPSIPRTKRQRFIYLMNEKIKQKLKDEIQSIKDTGVRREHYGSITSGGSVRDYSQRIPGNISSSHSYPIIQYERGTAEDFKRQEIHLKNLWAKINQPSIYTDMQSLILSSQELQAVYNIAVEAGMSMHEVDNLIEWNIDPLTREQEVALGQLIVVYANHESYPLEVRSEVRKKYAVVTGERYHPDWFNSDSVVEKVIWQIGELIFFVGICLDTIPRMLAKEPVRISSNIYDQTPKRERTQGEMVDIMTRELSNFPLYQAYAKLIDKSRGKQIVRTHRIQTHPLPAIKNPDGEVQAMINGYKFAKKRMEIEAEIRERQNRWGRGGSPPPQSRRIR